MDKEGSFLRSVGGQGKMCGGEEQARSGVRPVNNILVTGAKVLWVCCSSF